MRSRAREYRGGEGRGAPHRGESEVFVSEARAAARRARRAREARQEAEAAEEETRDARDWTRAPLSPLARSGDARRVRVSSARASDGGTARVRGVALRARARPRARRAAAASAGDAPPRARAQRGRAKACAPRRARARARQAVLLFKHRRVRGPARRRANRDAKRAAAVAEARAPWRAASGREAGSRRGVPRGARAKAAGSAALREWRRVSAERKEHREALECEQWAQTQAAVRATFRKAARATACAKRRRAKATRLWRERGARPPRATVERVETVRRRARALATRRARRGRGVRSWRLTRERREEAMRVCSVVEAAPRVRRVARAACACRARARRARGGGGGETRAWRAWRLRRRSRRRGRWCSWSARSARATGRDPMRPGSVVACPAGWASRRRTRTDGVERGGDATESRNRRRRRPPRGAAERSASRGDARGSSCARRARVRGVGALDLCRIAPRLDRDRASTRSASAATVFLDVGTPSDGRRDAARRRRRRAPDARRAGERSLRAAGSPRKPPRRERGPAARLGEPGELTPRWLRAFVARPAPRDRFVAPRAARRRWRPRAAAPPRIGSAPRWARRRAWRGPTRTRAPALPTNARETPRRHARTRQTRIRAQLAARGAARRVLVAGERLNRERDTRRGAGRVPGVLEETSRKRRGPARRASRGRRPFRCRRNADGRNVDLVARVRASRGRARGAIEEEAPARRATSSSRSRDVFAPRRSAAASGPSGRASGSRESRARRAGRARGGRASQRTDVTPHTEVASPGVSGAREERDATRVRSSRGRIRRGLGTPR